jgi:phosphate transport system protein
MTQIRHFDLEIAELKRSLATMGDLVERAVDFAARAIANPTVEAREQARVYEDQLDMLDSAIEDRCHQILALQAPMARDLRLLVSTMRVTLDLENIGDLAESLAKRATYIARHRLVRNPEATKPLSDIAKSMVHRAIESFITGNVALAKQVMDDEDRADELTKEGFAELKQFMRAEPDRIDEYLHLHRAFSHLEHIADIAVSIAEEAVYTQRGQMIRHHHDQLGEPQ